MNLWQMSFYGGGLIFAILVLRRILWKRMPRGSFLALWAVAAARLLVPVGVSSEFNIYSWMEEGVAHVLLDVSSALDRGSEIVDGAAGTMEGNGAIGGAAGAMEGNGTVEGNVGLDGGIGSWEAVWLEKGKVAGIFLTIGKTLESVWNFVYGVGLLACVFFYLRAYIKCRREFRFSLPIEDAFVREWQEALMLRRKVSVRQSEAVEAPLTYGIFRPVILLPKKKVWEGARQLEFALAHEAEHIRHFDAAKKLVLAAITCAHWFNPLVWRMQALANQDIELLCDARVVRRYGFAFRAEYASALIQMEENKGSRMLLGSSFSGTNMEERITLIMRMKKQTIGAALAAGVIVAGVTTIFAMTPVTEKQDAANHTEQTAEESVDGSVYTGMEYTKSAMEQLMYNIAASEEFPEYKKFGLSFQEDPGRLMYQGEVVGYFKDEIMPNTYRRFYTEDGSIGIVVSRGLSGEIIGFHTGGVEEVMNAFPSISGDGIVCGEVAMEDSQSAAKATAEEPGRQPSAKGAAIEGSRPSTVTAFVEEGSRPSTVTAFVEEDSSSSTVTAVIKE